MKRSEVDDDPAVTCSRGLHVAAFPYARDFYPNGKMMEVKVNPMDVVAVPDDYNAQKMRVCKYVVLRECEGPRPDQEVIYKYDDTADVDDWDEDNWDDDPDVDVDVEHDDAPTAIQDVSSQLAAVASDPNLTLVTHHAFEVDGSIATTVSLDGRGRICISANMLKSMGLKRFDIVYITPVGNMLRVTKVKASNKSRAYTVDRDRNVRISSYVLDLAGLKGIKQAVLTLAADRSEILVS
jgi:bifunctional DNA-binding transcriptional regulator/antitoxin component of YhaV-PrlF toxin-antitoxin module